MNVFKLWRSTTNGENKCPAHLLTNQCTVEELSDWLCRFVVEARHSDGKPYSYTTLCQLLAGLLRYARSEYANFIDKSDQHFANFVLLVKMLANNFERMARGPK